ncbi:DnaD domain protein [Bacillus sp. 165]|uniref:replication initiation and membrane attachment family protein n=1 Tax=Bacillus sp. 165 TaxID=1529117 RepID=UPI001AD97263|nr:DnaD domain protein [Bacillus sp. 165]MBO9130597.1 DnaD domain protein [Bacillus sp. 165]
MERQSWMELLPVDRYMVCTGGLLHSYDRKVLTMLYQPLIGARAFSLYMTLWGELEQNELYGQENTHHSLLVSMDMNLPDIFAERRKLEAIGLLKVYVKKEEDVRKFLYEIQPPLNPKQFFDDIVLNIFLYNRLGKTKYMKVKQYFAEPERDMTSYEEVTHAFNDVFDSVTPSQLSASLQSDTGEVIREPQVMGRSEASAPPVTNLHFNFELFFEGIAGAVIPKRSITKPVKECIMKLSFVYGIDTINMKNIIMGAITESNTINLEQLRKNARDWYQLEHGSVLPQFSQRTQPQEKRLMQGKVPVSQEEALIQQLEVLSPRELLIEISGGAEPAVADLQIIEEVMFKQKLLPGVVNVLIHYVMLKSDMKLSKTYVEKIASHWARKKINTVTEAMELAKQEHRQYQTWAESKNKEKRTASSKPTRKELVPEWLGQELTSDQTVQEEVDVEAQRKMLEEALKKYKKN